MDKKLLFFLINMNLGGTEKSFLNLVDALPDNVEVDLLLLEYKGQLLKQLPPKVNVRIIQENESVNFLIQKSLLKYAMYCLRKMNILQMCRAVYFYGRSKLSKSKDFKFETVSNILSVEAEKYDIAVAYAGPHDFISSYVAKKIIADKKIQWIHFDIEKVIRNFNFGSKLYPFFDQIFCVSKSSKEIFLKYFPQLRNKTEVFHNIILPDVIKQKSLELETYTDDYDGIRILTVGRFTSEKGQHLIPEVVRKLRADNFPFRWYLVGDGNQKEMVAKMSSDLGLIENLIFLGLKENPYPYMKDCDIYVQPSLHEGFGITIEEVKIFNKPIVITNFASATNLLEHEKTGLIVDISSDAIYRAVKALILDANLRHKFQKNLLVREILSTEEINKILY